MESTLLASGLGFPEGPTVLGDGRIVLCDGNTGELLAYADGSVSHYRPHRRLAVGYLARHRRQAVYVNQGGDVPGSGDSSAVPGIQRVSLDGTVELLFSEVAGYTLARPEPVGVRPGRPAVLHRLGYGGGLPRRRPQPRPDSSRSARRGAGEMLLERPGGYPNGIAFDAARAALLERVDGAPGLPAGRPRARRRRSASCPTRHVPDGMAFAADGRLFVANDDFGGVTVLSPDGEVLTEIELDEHATNCVFDGSVLYVTATRTPDIEASQRTGSLLAGRDGRHRAGADRRPPVAGGRQDVRLRRGSTAAEGPRTGLPPRKSLSATSAPGD